MLVRSPHDFSYCPPLPCSREVLHTQAAAFNDALERADGDGFVAVHCYDHLPAIRVTPFLMTAFLADHVEPMPAQDSTNIFGVANWIAFAHVRATSSTFAPGGIETGDGSNQSAKASFALRTASSSVSPADVQPGSSGKKAAQRLVPGSCSSTNRTFMAQRIVRRTQARNGRMRTLRQPRMRSLRLESEALGLIGVVDIVEGGPDGAEIID